MGYSLCMFMSLAGSLGSESTEGSFYMTEARFQDYFHGMALLREVCEGMNIPDAYSNFQQEKARAVGISYNEDEASSRAIVRLISLARITEKAQAKQVADTLFSMSHEEQVTLSEYLSPSSTQQPRFVLKDASMFIRQAIANQKCGLLPALRFISRVCEKACKTLNERQSIELHFSRYAELAKACEDPALLQNLEFELLGRKVSEDGSRARSATPKEPEPEAPAGEGSSESVPHPTPPSAPRTGNAAPRHFYTPAPAMAETGKMPARLKALVEMSAAADTDGGGAIPPATMKMYDSCWGASRTSRE